MQPNRDWIGKPESALPDQFQRFAEEGLEVLAGGGGFGFADRGFGLRTGAAQVQEGREDVLINGGESGGGSCGFFSGYRRELVAELQDDALGGLFAYAGDADQTLDFT